MEACLSNIIAVLFNLMPVYKVIFKEIAKRLGKCGTVQSYRYSAEKNESFLT